MMTAAQRLRQKLLDLAIRGKLVPQNPKDEPAEKLLARIREEKSHAEAQSRRGRGRSPSAPNGRATSMKSPQPIADDEKPFDIPPAWTWCRFRELGVITGGHTPSMANPKFWGGDVLWVSSKDMKSKYISNTGKKITKLGAAELTLLKRDAVLMCTRSGILRRTFPVALAAHELTINQDQRALSPHLPEMSEYIYTVLKAMESLILRDYRKTGTTVESIIWEKFINMPIPLPPLAEQKRIVAALDGMLKAADAVATGMEKIAALKDRARAKILDLAIRGKLVEQHAADEPAEKLLARIRRGEMSATQRTQRTQSSQRGAKNGMALCEALSKNLCDSLSTLRSLCQLPQGKGESCLRQLTQRAQSSQRNTKRFAPIAADEKPFDIPQGWAWCRLGEISDVQLGKMLDAKKKVGKECRYLANISVRWGDFDLKDLRTTFFTDDEVEKFSLRENDLLVCEGGVPGRCAVWRERDTDIKYQKAIHRVRPCGIDADYLQHYFEAIHDRPFFTSHFTGSTIHHLPREVLLNLPIPLPPLAEQKRIVAKVDEMLAACDNLASEA